MVSSSTYTLPPINAGDAFTCQGSGLLYEEIPRIPVEELRVLLSDGSGQSMAGNRKEPKKWFQAQCAHYGLPTRGAVANLRAQLDDFLTSPAAKVPDDIAQLEIEKNDEYNELNERIRGLTTRARSPTPGRTRRVTMSNTPESRAPASGAPTSSRTPRSRTKSLTGSSQTPLEPEPQTPVKRGRGRPRKSEPAHRGVTQIAQTNEQIQEIPLVSSGSNRPVPPSQHDSMTSAYPELDDDAMQALDEIEKNIDFVETDPDGDSQMNPPSSRPASPASMPASMPAPPAPPQTPRRGPAAFDISPSKKSPKATLERDVVSGMWSLRVTSYTTPNLISARREQSSLRGSMNLHLAEDKRSLVGEFSILGMDGVLQSKTLEGRIDGAYARLLFVGQMTIAKEGNGQGETINRVLGPSPSQNGYLRFSDGCKAGDGRFMLKGVLQGEGFGKVDFEGTRQGEEQELCANWDDFVD